MRCEAEIRFFCQTVEQMHIQTLRFRRDDMPEPDLGLRATLGIKLVDPLLFAQGKEKVLYSATDVFSCSYFALVLPEQEILLIGPYLRGLVDDRTLMQLLERCRRSPSALPSLRRYYDSLTCLDNDRILTVLVNTLCCTLWGGPDQYEMMTVSVHDDFEAARIQTENQRLLEETDIRVLEQRYEVERQLINAIAHGMTHQAQMIATSFSTAGMERRTADPLRDAKNYAIIGNTLMRKAAEQGAVHPLHIDRLSSSFAKTIESLRSIDEVVRLLRTMVHKYCLLVRNHSMRTYSQLVQHVILRIESDLTADLSLKAHADFLNVNSSYLSTLFKRETGITLTEYVNRQRIEHGIFLLNSTEMQVQTIAQHCGISDVNYFTKLFKRLIGKTPKEYRQDTHMVIPPK